MFTKKYSRSLVVICLILFQCLLLNIALAKQTMSKPAKYVFLFIGDGMGPKQVQAAEKFYGQLAFSGFGQQGQVTTDSAQGRVTDSAAAATAIACGGKTNNGVLGLDAQGNRLESIAELLKSKGFKIGIVSSMQLDDATPAGFYAHRSSRFLRYEIAQDLAVSNFDYFAGGGLRQPRGKDGEQHSIWQILVDSGYLIASGRQEFQALKQPQDKVFVRSGELYEDLSLNFAIDQRPGISLAEFTAKGIELLHNQQGFFMLVEGGKIDYAGHTNDLATNIKESGAFSEAVQVAVDFYKKHPRETLIVVTADHETGGLSFDSQLLDQGKFVEIVGKQNISYQEFGKLVSSYVQDGNSGDLQDWLPALKLYFGLDNLSEDEYSYLQQAAYASVKREKYGPYEPLMIAATRTVGKRAGASWSTYGHSGVNVPIYALGSGSDSFGEAMDNTQISAKILAAMGVTITSHELENINNGK